MITAVALVHFAFIVFVAFGGFLVLRWHKLAWIHLPAALWGALIEIFEWNCPLTGVENSLRQRAGASAYGGDFIAHYLFRVIYPTGLTRGLELVLAALVIVINAAIYVRVLSLARRS